MLEFISIHFHPTINFKYNILLIIKFEKQFFIYYHVQLRLDHANVMIH
jgi:pyoverdine/dityrosine biosynthesis protein Dit1